MRVLLLGASGLLGHNVTLQLLHGNHEVVAVVRNKNKLKIQESNLKVIEGNLTYNVLIEASKHCDAIINCVGITDMSLLHLEDYMGMNRDLCRLLIDTMTANNIQRLVHVSTANTIGYGTSNCPTDETTVMRYPFTQSWYAVSKYEGEQILQKAAIENPQWHIIIVNPGFMIGAYDMKPSSGKLLLMGYRKPLMVVPNGGKSFVAVKDVAIATIYAITQGQSGHRYLLTGKSMSLKQFYLLQSNLMGYRQRIITLPNGLVKIVGLLGDALRKLNIRTQIATRNVNQLLITEYYNPNKAIQELSMPQTPISQAIREFFEWQNNRVRK